MLKTTKHLLALALSAAMLLGSPGVLTAFADNGDDLAMAKSLSVQTIGDSGQIQPQSFAVQTAVQNEETALVFYSPDVEIKADNSIDIQRNTSPAVYVKFPSDSIPKEETVEWEIISGEDCIKIDNIFGSNCGCKISGVKEGKAVLQATLNDLTATCNITVIPGEYTVALRLYPSGITMEELKQAFPEAEEEGGYLSFGSKSVSLDDHERYYNDFRIDNPNRDPDLFVDEINSLFDTQLSSSMIKNFYFNLQSYLGTGTFIVYVQSLPPVPDKDRPVIITLLNLNDGGKEDITTISEGYYVNSVIRPLSEFKSDNLDNPVTSWQLVNTDENGEPIYDENGNPVCEKEYIVGSITLTGDITLYANHDVEEFRVRVVEVPAGTDTDIIHHQNIDEIDNYSRYTKKEIPGSIQDETYYDVPKTTFDEIEIFGGKDTTPLLNYLKEKGLVEADKIFESVDATRYKFAYDSDGSLFTITTFVFSVTDPPVEPDPTPDPTPDPDPDPTPDRPSRPSRDDDDDWEPLPDAPVKDKPEKVEVETEVPEETETPTTEQPEKHNPETGDASFAPVSLALAAASLSAAALLARKRK